MVLKVILKEYFKKAGAVAVFLLAFAGTMAGSGALAKNVKKYIIINGVPASPAAFKTIADTYKSSEGSDTRIGVGFIISYFRSTPRDAEDILRRYLYLSRQFNIPLVIQLDGEQWWQNRPDLWNWWDKNKAGYDPANKRNVEWTDWTPDSAVKIGWRNWSKQLRVLPMPNLMSPDYRKACHTEMTKLVKIVVDWWKQLPAAQKDLFVGLKVGWESAIGVNNFYFPGGNNYLDRPVEKDPHGRLTPGMLPGRGMAAIGYAAVSTAGLARSGELKESHLAEVIRVHLTDLSRLAHELGVPRDRLFTHCGGWSPGEQLYMSALNPYACPGWSFYKHAFDPSRDTTAMKAVEASDAPYWGVVEWSYQGNKTKAQWLEALKNTLSERKLKYMCIYNWRGFQKNENGKAAVKEYLLQ